MVDMAGSRVPIMVCGEQRKKERETGREGDSRICALIFYYYYYYLFNFFFLILVILIKVYIKEVVLQSTTSALYHSTRGKLTS